MTSEHVPWEGQRVKIDFNPRHPKPADRAKVVQWASELIQKPESWVILETESTSKHPDSTIIQIAVVDGNLEPLLSTFVRPPKGCHILPKLLTDNSIDRKAMNEQPTREEVFSQLQSAVKGKHVVTYNLEWRRQLLIHNHLLPTENAGWSCAMLQYATFAGYWMPQKRDYRYLKLPKPLDRFDAVQDCVSVQTLIKAFASSQSQQHGWSLWQFLMCLLGLR